MISSIIHIYYFYNIQTHAHKMSIFARLPAVAAPTSFEGPFGKIVYRVKAVIDTPRFSKDYKAQRPFYLLNLLNLNEVPDIDVRNLLTLCTFPQTEISHSLFCFRAVRHLAEIGRNSVACLHPSLCSILATLWSQRSSTTSWWKRERWCSKPAATWGATFPVRSSG